MEREPPASIQLSEFETEATCEFTRTAPVQHARHHCFRVEPVTRVGKAHGNENRFTREHRFGWAHQHPARREILHAIGDEMEVPEPHDLARNSEHIPRRPLVAAHEIGSPHARDRTAPRPAWAKYGQHALIEVALVTSGRRR